MHVNRRNFIRIVGGVGLSSAIAPRYVIGESIAHYDNSGVLAEASSFQKGGGWKLDTQHFQQMGGSYLLAHGVGLPVDNARTHISVKESGRWHVFVRTRDWCPGDWQAPGRFRVHIDGQRLQPEFGVTSEDWHWQHGGSIDLPKAGEVEIVLEDLTGFA
ncbi:MAG: hypothetical protein HOH33_00420, partial [Verrucomicrobia bacterium]|nr:hypothetical protein [Verrucomicrobiota bacterium]